MSVIFVLLAIIVVLWVSSTGAGLLSLLWSVRFNPRRFVAGIIASAFALLIGFVGATRIHVAYSVTTNGSHWGIDSRWFFIVPLLLGLLSLVLTLLAHRRCKAVADVAPPLSAPSNS